MTTAPTAAPVGVELPPGYRPYDPLILGLLRALFIDPLSATAQAAGLYGGATMNWAIGGDNLWRLGCCAEYQGFFKFRVFTFQNGALTEIPITDIGEGRGWLGYDLQGYMCCSSWQGSQFRPATGPGKVPGVPPIPVSGGGGGLTIPDGGYIRILADQDGYQGDTLITLAEKGVPAASVYQVKLSVDGALGRKARVGPPQADPNKQNGAMLTVPTLGPGDANRNYGETFRAATNGQLLVRADLGVVDHLFVDITGWQ